MAGLAAAIQAEECQVEWVVAWAAAADTGAAETEEVPAQPTCRINELLDQAAIGDGAKVTHVST